MSQTLFVSTRKGLFTVEKGPHGYEVTGHHFHGEPVTQFLVDPRDGAWYAALRMGHFGVKMRKSIDRGANWSEIASPAFPAKPTEGSWADDTHAWSNDMVWSLACAGARAGELWAGCAPAGLFHSKDGGASWQLVESLWFNEKRKAWFGGGYDHAGIHSICVDPRDHRHVTIAISCGGVWTTHDEGITWTLIGEGMIAPYMPEDGTNDPNTQDAHSLAQCAASPEVMWVQHHAGCYRSTDGGKHFSRLTAPTSADFGFPIVCDSTNPLRAWLVPARADTYRYATDAAMHVARTDDGGKSWQILRRGLPQTHAYDLVYRHGLAIGNDNTTLAIGSTTGGLWISEDAGETWDDVGARLPPVAAVAFA